MRSGWINKKLGAVSAISYGYTESACAEPVGPRFLRITDIQNDNVDWDKVPYCKIDPADIPKYRLANGDMVFARTGATTGKSLLVSDPPDAVAASYLVRLRLIDNELLPEFVSFFFQTSTYWKAVGEGLSGSAQGGFNATKLGELSIPVPPLSEQQRIVRILDEAFESIATAKTNTERNLQNARALFESDLEEALMHPGGDWSAKNFFDVCEISSVLVDPRSDGYENLPHVGGANIVSKTGELVGLKTAKEERLISGKFTFDGSMVLYSKIRPYLMKVARPNFRGLCSADTYPLSAKVGQLDRDFLFYLLLSRRFTDYANQGSARAGMPKVNREHLFAFRAHLPPITEQKSIASKLDALCKETQRLESIYRQRLAALEALKKSLLHQAFTGQL